MGDSPLEIDPPEFIPFAGPFAHDTTAMVKLTNTSARPVGFKVKTTAQERFKVAPPWGIIEPHSETSVAVHLTPLGQTDDVDKINKKDKFQFQYCYASDDIRSITDRSAFEKFLLDQGSEVMAKKLKVKLTKGVARAEPIADARSPAAESKVGIRGQRSREALEEEFRPMEPIQEQANPLVMQTKLYVALAALVVLILLVCWLLTGRGATA